MNYVIGIAANGERLRFERWIYEAWLRHDLHDAPVLEQLRRCARFVTMY